MMMLPSFQRRWGSVYDALMAGRIDASGVEELVATYPLDGGESVYALDSSTWLKNDAETSPKRGYYHHHNRHSAGKPIVAGWSYQWLTQVSFHHDSWSAPLSAYRVEPTDNVQQMAATQIRALLKRRPQHTALPIFVFDAGYDAVQLAQILGDETLSCWCGSNRIAASMPSLMADPREDIRAGMATSLPSAIPRRGGSQQWNFSLLIRSSDGSISKPGRRCTPNRISMPRAAPTNPAP